MKLPTLARFTSCDARKIDLTLTNKYFIVLKNLEKYTVYKIRKFKIKDHLHI